jgi:hypothetical protein
MGSNAQFLSDSYGSLSDSYGVTARLIKLSTTFPEVAHDHGLAYCESTIDNQTPIRLAITNPAKLV